MNKNLQVLVASPYPETRQLISSILGQCKLEPVLSSTVSEARRVLALQPISLVFCEDHLPDGSFRDILGEAGRGATRIPVVVIARLGDWDRYLEAMRFQVFDYVACPFQRADVEWIVNRALRASLVLA